MRDSWTRNMHSIVQDIQDTSNELAALCIQAKRVNMSPDKFNFEMENLRQRLFTLQDKLVREGNDRPVTKPR